MLAAQLRGQQFSTSLASVLESVPRNYHRDTSAFMDLEGHGDMSLHMDQTPKTLFQDEDWPTSGAILGFFFKVGSIRGGNRYTEGAT